MFCKFQIFLLYGTGGMGLRRRKMIKTSKKTFLPGPSKTCWGFLPTFFKSFRYGWILYAERIFCHVLFSLHRLLNKTTALQQDSPHHKYTFKTTKDVSSENLAYNVLRVDVASAVRKNRNEKPIYLLQGQSIVSQLFCKFAYQLFSVNVYCLCTSWNC